MSIETKVIEGSLDGSKTIDFDVHEAEYFIAISDAYDHRFDPKLKGHMIYTFDGQVFTSRMLESNYNYFTSYMCEKF